MELKAIRTPGKQGLPSACRRLFSNLPASTARLHGSLLSSKLSAISRVNEASTSTNFQAVTLDAAQPLRPAQQHASTWQQATLFPAPEDPCDTVEAPSQQVWQAHQHKSAVGTSKRHINTAFGAFDIYMALMAAAAKNPDWHLDVAAFGGLWALLWAASMRLQPSANTVALVCLLPVMHLSGALGMYTWELGNLSWDVLVHITNGFIGTLLFAAVLQDMAAASNRQEKHKHIQHSPGSSTGQPAAAAAASPLWQERAWGVLKVTGLLLFSTSMIEVLEAAGGQLAGHAGEGIFLRGLGDLCTASLPCSAEVDTAKDMVDNCAGMMLALLALATRGASTDSTRAVDNTSSSNT